MSKTIQYISFFQKEDADTSVTYSRICEPESMDSFEINIIDLNDPALWCYDNAGKESINSIQDLKNVKSMISHSRQARYLILFPGDCLYSYGFNGKQFAYSEPLKNRLNLLYGVIKQGLLPINVVLPELLFENTKTIIEEKEVLASFYFNTSDQTIITSSYGSEKTTTCRLSERITASTLLFTDNAQAIAFAKSLFLSTDAEEAPTWMKEITFGSDIHQKEIIDSCEHEIEQCQLRIAVANAKLKENDKYKSILYSQGDQLVDVVFDILQHVLCCDLSEFVDKKREDFRIKKVSVTFIGEIKGINSNVKSDNVSQVDRHCALYSDELQEKGLQEDLKQLLIINPLRKQPPAEREPMNEAQLKLAKRNNCLIIKTEVLLRIFEAFQEGILTTEQIERCFSEKSGELMLNDIIPVDK